MFNNHSSRKNRRKRKRERPSRRIDMTGIEPASVQWYRSAATVGVPPASIVKPASESIYQEDNVHQVLHKLGYQPYWPGQSGCAENLPNIFAVRCRPPPDVDLNPPSQQADAPLQGIPVATLPPLQPPIPEDDLNDWSRGRRRHNIGLRSKHPNMYSDVGPPSEQPAACHAPEQPPPDDDSPSKQTAVPPPPEVPLPPNVDPPSQEAAALPAVPRQVPFRRWAYDEWGYDVPNMESLYIALTDGTRPLARHVDLENNVQDNGDEGGTPRGLRVGRRSDEDTADSSLTESR